MGGRCKCDPPENKMGYLLIQSDKRGTIVKQCRYLRPASGRKKQLHQNNRPTIVKKISLKTLTSDRKKGIIENYRPTIVRPMVMQSGLKLVEQLAFSTSGQSFDNQKGEISLCRLRMG